MADRAPGALRWLREPIGLTGAGIAVVGLTLLLVGWRRRSSATATLGLGLVLTGILQVAGAATELRRQAKDQRAHERSGLDELRRLVRAAQASQRSIGPMLAATIINSAVDQHHLVSVDELPANPTHEVCFLRPDGRAALTLIMTRTSERLRLLDES